MSCSCHINPPCGYCTSQYRCDKCDDIYGLEDLDENMVCTDCRPEWDDDDCDGAGGDTEL